MAFFLTSAQRQKPPRKRSELIRRRAIARPMIGAQGAACPLPCPIPTAPTPLPLWPCGHAHRDPRRADETPPRPRS